MGNLPPPFLSVAEFWLNSLKALSHLFNGPSASDLRAQVFTVLYYLLFSLGLVYLGV